MSLNNSDYIRYKTWIINLKDICGVIYCESTSFEIHFYIKGNSITFYFGDNQKEYLKHKEYFNKILNVKTIENE